MNNGQIITFPQTANGLVLYKAVMLALSDEDFMGNSKKVRAAGEALTPKDTLTATLKRLQKNGNRDYLEKKDQGVLGYTDASRAEKIKGYVLERFQAYMDDPKTSEKAIKLFKAAYPAKEETTGAIAGEVTPIS
jgi:hypothetical protein